MENTERPRPRFRFAAPFAVVTCLATLAVCELGRDDYFLGSALWFARWPLLLCFAVLAIRAWRFRRPVVAALAILGATATLAEWMSIRLGRESVTRLSHESPTLTVVSHNLLFQGAEMSESLGALADSDADVLALQEVTAGWQKALQATLASEYPYRAVWPHEGASGVALYSRYPFDDVRLLGPPAKLPFAQCATLRHPDGPVAFCNVHLSSPAGALHGQRGVLPVALEKNAWRRVREWKQVSAELKRRGEERTMVVGDFNTLEVEPLYRQVRHDFVDAFRLGSRDVGATWPNVPSSAPFVRIDYVFVKGALQPVESEVVMRSGSDHLPVRATVRVGKRG